MGPIGVFDSGFGGLTVMKEIKAALPTYDFLYLGDNARAPYGTRSFESVYEFTWQGVEFLFQQGCQLVILACNTASAKALRNIQQKKLPIFYPNHRVLGVIRPTTEEVGNWTKSKHLGILATSGTVLSESYKIEINKFFPDIQVYQTACPMWVPLIENNEIGNEGADYFIKKYLNELLAYSNNIDCILLACTHYPVLLEHINKCLNSTIEVKSQGQIVAEKLKDYLKRHPEIDMNCNKKGEISFLTTDSASKFNESGSLFYGLPIRAKQVRL